MSESELSRSHYCNFPTKTDILSVYKSVCVCVCFACVSRVNRLQTHSIIPGQSLTSLETPCATQQLSFTVIYQTSTQTQNTQRIHPRSLLSLQTHTNTISADALQTQSLCLSLSLSLSLMHTHTHTHTLEIHTLLQSSKLMGSSFFYLHCS